LQSCATKHGTSAAAGGSPIIRAAEVPFLHPKRIFHRQLSSAWLVIATLHGQTWNFRQHPFHPRCLGAISSPETEFPPAAFFSLARDRNPVRPNMELLLPQAASLSSALPRCHFMTRNGYSARALARAEYPFRALFTFCTALDVHPAFPYKTPLLQIQHSSISSLYNLIIEQQVFLRRNNHAISSSG
jgi:hypothetical protein